MTDQQELWTTVQCAEHCGIEPSTWRDYVARHGAPQPACREAGRGGQSLFVASAVQAWHAGRQGRGWWGSHQREDNE